MHSIYESRSGLIWFGTLNSINIVDRTKDAFNHYRHNFNNTASLGDKAVSAIYEDQSGIIWIGTSDGGLDKFDRKAATFSHFKHDPAQPGSLSKLLTDKLTIAEVAYEVGFRDPSYFPAPL